MTQEEKAKAYDEAIERAKAIIKVAANQGEAIDFANTIFPELKESEDERIRKELITHCRNTRCVTEEGAEGIAKWIAWLENIPYTIDHEKREGFHLGYKAGLEKQRTSYTKRDVDDAYVEGMAFAKDELEKQGEQKSQRMISAEAKEALFDYENANIQQKDFAPKSAMEAIKEEKVDNQNCVKSTDKVESKFKVGDFIIKSQNSDINKFGKFKITGIKDDRYWYNEFVICKISEQNEWELVKIKPKFKVGDWVVYCGKTCKITGLRNGIFTITNQDGSYFFNQVESTTEPVFHFWTIQDAKDGDVLISKDKEDILIYKSYSLIDLLLTSYISFSKKEGFCPRQYSAWDSNEFIPATKEQRDLLFQKMKEKGYEWDAEKKESKKINNALEECEIEHIEHGKYYYCIKDYYGGGCKRASKGEVVQALRGMSMMALGVKANEYFIPVKRIVDVSPACSEEDERSKNAAISACKYMVDNFENSTKQYEDAIDWLKSLRPQNTWKPSDKQMHAFEQVYDWYDNNFAPSETLTSLYNDLKKLKE